MAKDAKGHGSESRGGMNSRSIPLSGHPYHTKTNDQLRYIQKDAHEAARANPGGPAELKYLDQVNDASTVLGFRQRGGADFSAKETPGGSSGIAAQHGIATGHLDPSQPHAFQGNPHSDEAREYNRDLALRSRNGQVGSGMRFRG